MAEKETVKVFYDGECPFCSRYVKYIKFVETVGQPELIDLREDKESREAFETEGHDVDKGMVLQIGQQTYHGKDAVNKMADLSSPSTFFNKLNHYFLSSSLMAAILYPIMVFFRNLTLELLGQRFIKDEDGGRVDPAFDFFKSFAWIYGLYCVFHFSYLTYYSETIAPVPAPLSWAFVLLAVFVVLRPWATHIFTLLIVVRAAEMWLQMPMTSNHAIIDFFFQIIFILTGVVALLRRFSWNEFVALFAPAGRWLLIIMYVFGIFHKINTDFLNPEYSCAVFLWQQYPFPDFVVNGLWAHYLAIYGTFVVEGLIMLGLVFRKTRYIAVIMGMGFHMFLGLSGNAYYGPFSMLSIALHSLFLPQSFLASFKSSKVFELYKARPLIVKLLLVNFALVLYLFAAIHNHILLTLMFVLVSVPFFIAVIRYAKEYKDAPTGWKLLAMGPLGTLLVLLYFLNNAAPYIGLKTHQSLNMFSNLHIDASRTNHLVITQPPTMLPFLKDVVTIEYIKWSEDPEINLAPHPHMAVVYHSLLATMEELREAEKEQGGQFLITYTRNGVRYVDVGTDHFKTDIDSKLLPAYMRKVILFEGLDQRQPRPCTAFR